MSFIKLPVELKLSIASHVASNHGTISPVRDLLNFSFVHSSFNAAYTRDREKLIWSALKAEFGDLTAEWLLALVAVNNDSVCSYRNGRIRFVTVSECDVQATAMAVLSGTLPPLQKGDYRALRTLQSLMSRVYLSEDPHFQLEFLYWNIIRHTRGRWSDELVSGYNADLQVALECSLPADFPLDEMDEVHALHGTLAEEVGWLANRHFGIARLDVGSRALLDSRCPAFWMNWVLRADGGIENLSGTEDRRLKALVDGFPDCNEY